MTKLNVSTSLETKHARACIVLFVCIIYALYRLITLFYGWLRYGNLELISPLEIGLIKPSTTWVGLNRIFDLVFTIDIMVFVIVLAAWSIHELLIVSRIIDEDQKIALRESLQKPHL